MPAPKKSTSSAGAQSKKGSRGGGLLINIAICLTAIALVILSVSWTLSDINGEYEMKVLGRRVLTLSVHRIRDHYSATLGMPDGRIVIQEHALAPKNDHIDWKFPLEPKTDSGSAYEGIAPVHDPRSLILRARLKDGNIEGSLYEGKSEKRVLLRRNNLATMHQSIRRTMP